MKRSLRTVYVVAAVASVVIFALGVGAGIYVGNSVFSAVESDVASIRADVDEAQQEIVLFSFRGKESCAVLSSLSDEISTKLSDLSSELIRLESGGEGGARFAELKQEFGSLTVRAWILRSTINANCDEQVLPVLYYYSVPCEACIDQGRVLDAVLDEGFRGQVSVYALDKDIQQPLVRTVVKSHSIMQTPSIVIEDDVYQGLMPRESIVNDICQKTNASACARNASG